MEVSVDALCESAGRWNCSRNKCQMAQKNAKCWFWKLSNKLSFQAGAAPIMTSFLSPTVSGTVYSPVFTGCLTLIISLSLRLFVCVSLPLFSSNPPKTSLNLDPSPPNISHSNRFSLWPTTIQYVCGSYCRFCQSTDSVVYVWGRVGRGVMDRIVIPEWNPTMLSRQMAAHHWVRFCSTFLAVKRKFFSRHCHVMSVTGN